jgi:hypothetical protein
VRHRNNSVLAERIFVKFYPNVVVKSVHLLRFYLKSEKIAHILRKELCKVSYLAVNLCHRLDSVLCKVRAEIGETIFYN